MSYQVRKYLFNGHRPMCSQCGAYIPMDEWFFARKPRQTRDKVRDKFGSTSTKWPAPGPSLYSCICCRFKVGVELKAIINNAFEVYEGIRVKYSDFITYPKAKKLADKAKEIYEWQK